VPWGHTRSYLSRLSNSETNGNGFNWQVAEWPYLVFDFEGNVAVMGQLNGALWFDKMGGTFAPRFGVKSTLELDSTAGVYRLFDLQGNVTEFDDFTGMFRKFTAAGGSTLEVKAMASNGYNFTEVERSYIDGGSTVTEQFLYEYGTEQADCLLSQITLRRKIDSGSWQNVLGAKYTYYDYTSTNGGQEDLETATTMEWRDGQWVETGTTYYRYYKQLSSGSSSSSSSSSSAGPQLDVYLIKYIVEPDSFSRLAADPNVADPLTATDAQVAMYADNYFEYDEQRRVTKERVEGGSQTFLFEYAESAFDDGVNSWKTRTTETLPDGSQNIIYCNYAAVPLLRVHKSGTDEWCEFFKYDEEFNLVLQATPAAVSGYDEQYADLLHEVSGNYEYLRDSAGLIRTYTYHAPTNWLASSFLQEGELGTPIKLLEREYIECGGDSSSSSSSSGSQSAWFLSKETEYPTDSETTTKIITSYSYTWHDGTCQVKEKITTLPVISTAQNGSGVSNSRKEYFDEYSYNPWRMDERGYITRNKFDISTGALTQLIQDVDTSVETDHPVGWSTPADGGLNLITDFEHDDRGRITQSLGPVHEVDLSGVATNLRTATWFVYTESSDEDIIKIGQGYATGSSPSYTYTLVNPVRIIESRKNGKPLEQIQATRASSNGKLTSADTFAQSSYTRWSTMQYSDCCHLASERVYHTIPASGGGESGANYDETSYGYDLRKRRNRTVTPGGTVTRMIYDTRSNVLSTWIGTDDTGATASDPTGGGATGNNMVQITGMAYDNGLDGGNGNLTQDTQYIDASNTRVTSYIYDFRDRRIETDGEIDYFQKVYYDNLDRIFKTERYDTTSSGNLISRNETKHDDLSRVCRQINYGVDPSTGTVGNSLSSNTWYDQSGNVVKSLPSGSKLFTKTTIDSLGRRTVEYTGYDLDETDYADIFNVADDTILEQNETIYDDGSNTVETLNRQRYHNAPAAQTGALQDPTTTPKARVNYRALYPDAVGRQVAQANYGTNGGTALSRSATIPTRSDTILINSMLYDSAGNLDSVTDPSGMVTKMEYDDRGRETRKILNVIESSSSSSSGGLCQASDDTNIAVQTAYNADGNVSAITAENSVTGNQVTQYIYGTTLADSGVASTLLKRKEIYPDSADSSDVILFSYNRQRQQTSLTDQNGSVHSYDYDKLGRMTQDRISTLGTGVDGAVRRIAMTYEVRGMRETLTSYDNPVVGTGSIVNEVQFAYNDFRQLTADYQAHDGAVNISSTPKVQYGYDSGADNTIRQTTMTYPNGRVLTYNYGTASGMDDVASRLAALVDDDVSSTHLVDYSYLGRGMSAQSVNSPFGSGFVTADSPQPQVQWTLVDLTGSNDPDTGDIYSGYDRFGRIKDNRWYDYDALIDVDRIKYGYDRSSNRIWRQNTVAEALSKHFDELYGNDQINRLKDFQRGTLNTQKDGVTDKSFAECWSLDPTGNWNNYLEDKNGDGTWDLNQSRSSNTVNEITALSDSVGPNWNVPTYDRNGNMISIPKAPVAGLTWAEFSADEWDNLTVDEWAEFQGASSSTATYDAWNRLVRIADASTTSTVMEYAYDGAKRRIVQQHTEGETLEETRHCYFTEPSKWQVIEERLGSSADAEQQLVWGLRYIDNILLRNRDTTGNGTLEERLYGLQDANWNTTVLVDVGGDVLERFAYTAYGQPDFLNASFSLQSSSSSDWKILYSAYYLDEHTELFQIRNRRFNGPLGVWVQRDPLNISAGLNVYEYCESIPLTYVDPSGQAGILCGFVTHPVVNCLCAALQILDTALSIATAILGPAITTAPWALAISALLDILDCACDMISIYSLSYCCANQQQLGPLANSLSCLFDIHDFLSIRGVSGGFSAVQQAIGELISLLGAEYGPAVEGELGTLATCLNSF